MGPLFHEKGKAIKKETTTIRQFKESAIIEFGAWLVKFNWSVLLRITNVNKKYIYFMTIMWNMINKSFPPTKVVISNCDKDWMTPQIKLFIADRQKLTWVNILI